MGLLCEIRKLPCSSCGSPPPNDVSHIRSRGAGGGDEEWNVVPMCRKCHSLWHTQGAYNFVQLYRKFLKKLEQLGWTFNGNKLIRKQDNSGIGRSSENDQQNTRKIVEGNFRGKGKMEKKDFDPDDGPEAA